ncbi:MAG: EAL domain-containing protein [Gammaproteobacteria bacterium]|nr:EAL domain-containing protein [Gammaproteobacteria bacterium]
MTLSRRLALLVVVLLLLVFLGTFFTSVRNTRDYLEAQLESHAQDAATSLGLSISTFLAQGDQATVDSMSDAIFDRGYYRMLTVENADGKSIKKLELPIAVDGIPSWFISAFPLETPVGEASVMSGWTQAGRVLIQSHPGYAYIQLWGNAKDTALWFLVSALFILLLGMVLLRWLLRPLRRIEWQADSICNREFPVLDDLPRTPDLRRIMEAMNRMTVKVQRMISELESLAGRLRRQAYQHPVTGLDNKRRFMDVVTDRIESDEDFMQGAFCLVQLKSFKEYNDRMGYQAGDDLLCQVAHDLQKVTMDVPKHTLAHLAGADFGLLVEDCSLDESKDLCRQVSAVLSNVYGTGRPESPDVAHVGAAYFDGRQSLKQLFSEADMALRSAQSHEANSWHLTAPDDLDRRVIRGASEWRLLIEEALEQDRITLLYQPVVTCPQRNLMHREVLVRIPDPDSGELVSAGVFLPVAESVGLATRIDKAVVAKVIGVLMEEQDADIMFAINLSPQSLVDDGFTGWLERKLSQHANIAGRLVFEFPEYGVTAHLSELKALIERVGRFGTMFSLDHFGHSFSSLAYLRSLKVHYLKIDGSYLRTLEENGDHQFFIQALTDIAHGLDIRVIAESVESETVWELLPSLHLDGVQGYYIGRPE